jgi:hypothetical protein
MEKIRDWFGTPLKAGSTLIWLLWVALLMSVFVTVILLLILVVQSVLD